MGDARLHELALDRFWDELVGSPGGPVAGEDCPRPGHGGPSASFRPAGRCRRPRRYAARPAKRAGHAAFAATPKGTTSESGCFFRGHATDVPATNGRTVPLPERWPRLRFPAAHHRWSPARVAAAAALVLLTLSGTWLAFGRVLLPPGQGSAISDVPMYRGGRARTGEMPGPGPATKPNDLWRLPDPRRDPFGRRRSPAASSTWGATTAASTPSTRTGEQRWSVATGGPVWLVTGGGRRHCLHQQRRRRPVRPRRGGRDGALAPTGVRGNNLGTARRRTGPSTSAAEDGLVALDPGAAPNAGASRPGDRSPRSPAMAEGVSTPAARTATSTPSTPQAARTLALPNRRRHLGTPRSPAGIVYQVAFDGPADRLYALDAATGAERWRFDTGASGLPRRRSAAGSSTCERRRRSVCARRHHRNVALALRDRRPDQRRPGAGRRGPLRRRAGQQRLRARCDDRRPAVAGRGRGPGGLGPTVSGGIVFVGTLGGTFVALGEPAGEPTVVLPAVDAEAASGPAVPSGKSPTAPDR